MKRFKNILRWCLTLSTIFMMITVFFQSMLYASQGLQLLESSDRGVTIQFIPEIERIDTIRLNTEDFYKIYIARTTFIGDPGQPMIPSKIINVGIPLDCEANVRILSAESEEFRGKLLPVPEIDPSGIYSYEILSSVYQSSDFYPQRIIKTEPPGFLRNQRVITIKLNIMQFAGGQNRIRFYNKVLIRVDFDGEVKESIGSRNVMREDEFYRGVIVNFPQSKKWLKQHVKKVKRAGTSFQNDNWYKIYINQEGIYQITGSYLSKLGIDIESIKAQSIRIYNNGGRELPRSFATSRPDSLIENAIRVVDLNDDGKFESSDYVIFYGKAVNNWEPLNDSDSLYQHYINHYTNDNVYWLTWDSSSNGKRMENKISPTLPDLAVASNFWGLYYDEDEINNFLNSGLDWFGRLMVGTSEQGYSVPLPYPTDQEDIVNFRIRVLGLSSALHRFTIYINDNTLSSFEFYGNRLETHEIQKKVLLSPDGYNRLKIKYFGASSESQAYIDWFEIQYKKQFRAEDGYLIFNQTADGPQKYRITDFQGTQTDVYDITDWSNVQYISNTEISSGSVTFIDTAVGFPRRKYIALTPEAYKTPEKTESVNLADLRDTISGADFIIVTHDDFYQAVLSLEQHREMHDTLATEVVKISDIYNEFSWGLVDPIAIRDFVKFAFDNWAPTPKYVLLCGDGDYDYKNRKSDLDKNWLPPYETTELNENANRTMDEFFVLVNGEDSKPDLAIGRFPVQSAEETQNVVEKIIEYETAPYWNPAQTHPLEDWRHIVTMVADDEYHNSSSSNETMHTRDTEYIFENYIPNFFDKEKIYLIEYPAIKDPSTSGFRKPAATEALLKRINNGTLILNYVGHGAPSIWADERLLLENRDVDRIQNQQKLTLWIAATCDFGRFDDPLEQGMAEKLFSAKGRGGIAFLTSARLAFATDNTALNREFYAQLFKDESGTTERLGVALILAKINNYSSTNDQKYHLFGDPAMRLAVPDYSAKILSIKPDTLKALSEIEITGQIEKQNFIQANFEGKALLKVFDSKSDKIYTTPFGSQIPYRASGNTIFRGGLSIEDGKFVAKFIVPKDITYGGKLGRISIYFGNEQVQGSGYRDYIAVGGTSILQDAEGPIIKIGFEGQNFIDGNLVGTKSILEVEIADSISGVNIAGDIGHNITMVVDEQENDEVILTDLFNYFEGNFKAGKVLYDFSTYKKTSYDKNNNLTQQYGLTPGDHTIKIKAWDNFNNSSIVTASFNIVSEDELKVSQVFNFPNPFGSSTTFTYVVSQDCQVKIKVYTIAGRLIETLDSLPGAAGTNQFYWEGRDRDGDMLSNGVYLYKIIAAATRQDKSLKDEYIGKLVVAR